MSEFPINRDTGSKKMKYKNLLAIIIFLAILLAVWFYWFQYRPVSIRKMCYQESFEKYNRWIELNKSNDKTQWAPEKEWINNPKNGNNSDWGWWYPVKTLGADLDYSDCLLKNGLSSETPNLELINKLRK